MVSKHAVSRLSPVPFKSAFPLYPCWGLWLPLDYALISFELPGLEVLSGFGGLVFGFRIHYGLGQAF